MFNGLYYLQKKTVAPLLKIIVFLSFLFIGIALPQSLHAQQCEPFDEIIVTLRDPSFGQPTVWEATYKRGDSTPVEFYSILYQSKRTAIVIGKRLNAKASNELFFIEINRRGRVLREVLYPAMPEEVPKKMFRHNDRIVVLSDYIQPKETGGPSYEKTAERKVKLSFYDDEFVQKDEIIIQDPEHNLTAQSITKNSAGDGFIIVMQAENVKDKKDKHSVIAEYSVEGKEIWTRSYRVGIPNRITRIKAVDDRSFIAVGQIEALESMDSGWVMKLDKSGAILWQQTYRRGAEADVQDVVILDPNTSFSQPSFLFLGNVKPNDGSKESTWVVRTDSLGQVLWQRYFRVENHAFKSRWLHDYGDGRVLVIGNAEADKDDDNGRNHIRMLSLSPRGIILGDEAYIEGFDSKAIDFIPGPNKERIVASQVSIDVNAVERLDPIQVLGIGREDQPEEEVDEFFEFSEEFSMIVKQVQKDTRKRQDIRKKGWVLIAPALDRYTDPCLPL